MYFMLLYVGQNVVKHILMRVAFSIFHTMTSLILHIPFCYLNINIMSYDDEALAVASVMFVFC